MKQQILKTCIYAIIGLTYANIFSQSPIWIRKCHSESRETYGVAFSNDNSKILTGSECHQAQLRIFDVLTGDISWQYEVDSSMMCIAGVKFSSNGKYLSTLEELGNLIVFDYEKDTPTHIFTVQTGTLGAFALDFSPDNSKIVSGLTNNKIIIYELPTGNICKTFNAHAGFVLDVDYSNDGLKIVSSGTDNRIKIWDNTGNLLHTLLGHTDDVYSVKFSSDNRFIVSGSLDKTLKVWDAQTGNLIRTISGHKGGIRQISISADGTKVASASVDSTVMIWDISSGVHVKTLPHYNSGKVYTTDWSKDGTKLVSGTSNGDVLYWDINSILSIQNQLSQKTSVYPNPTSQTFKITFADNTSINSLSISNSIGQVIHYFDENNFNLNQQEFALNLPKGFYTLIILYNENIAVYKQLIIQ